MKSKAPYFWLTCLLGGLFVITAQVRTLNYVCGNDPMLYIRAARTFLSPGFYGAEAVRDAATFVAPGYPLILAGCIGLFGTLSPYWLNLVFVLGTIPLLFGVLKTLMHSERAACFSVLGLLWILLAGHELHAPYLLYPFREASRIFFTTLCFWACLNAFSRPQRWKSWTLLSAFSLIAACGIREPTAFVLPGLLLGTVGLKSPEGLRGKQLTVFLIPWLVIGLVMLLVMWSGSFAEFSQFSVSRYLRNHQTALERISKMLPWFPERAGGWAGCLLILTGLVRAGGKSRTLLCWFALPALLFFVFYAYVHMHVRYFMTTLIFLLPFAGYGLEGILRLLEGILPGKRTVAVTTSLVLCGAVYGLIRTAEDLEPWGPETTSAQVRVWQQRIGNLEQGADGKIHIALEQRCRYLEDMILSYTDAQLLDPKQTENWPETVFPATYFYPRNRAAFYATPQWLDYKEVYAHRQIEHVFNLLPAGKERLYIGQGEYEEFTISPFSSGVQVQEPTVPPEQSALLLLNWGDTDAEAVRELKIVKGGRAVFSLPVSGKGIQAVLLSAETVGAGGLRLEVDSPAPVPRHPVFAVLKPGGSYVLEVGTDRLLSSNFLLTNRKDSDVRPAYPALRTDRMLMFQPPVLYDPNNSFYWRITLIPEKLPAESGWQVTFALKEHELSQTLPLQSGTALPYLDVWDSSEFSMLLIAPGSASEPRRLNLKALELRLGNPSSPR